MRRTNSFLIAVLLIALDIIFTRFLHLYTPGNVDCFSLQFIPNALSGFLFGPLYGALILVLGDVLGAFVSSGGAVFSLFTVTAALKGLIYGFMLYNRELTVKRIFLTFLLVAALLDIGLNSVWNALGGGFTWLDAAAALLLTRSIFVIAQTILFSLISRPVKNRF